MFDGVCVAAPPAADATCCADCAAAAAVADAAESAPTLGAATVGRPVLAPLTCRLAAFTTVSAEMLALPEERMPASPASMVPCGATRFRSPGGTPASAARVAIPAPVTVALGDRLTLPR